MARPTSPVPAARADVLASWDRLGFRLLFFGTIAAIWTLQSRMNGWHWSDAIRAELAGTMPWAFLAPIILALWKRFPIDRQRWARAVAAHLGGMVLVLVPYWLMERGVTIAWHLCTHYGQHPALPPMAPILKSLRHDFQMLPFIYMLVLLGAAALDQSRARKEEEAQARALAGQLAEARLGLLQRQLHPHFLFNALQAISTLLHRDPQTADRLLVRLSTLLRAMLDEASSQTLPLRTELDLTRKYLEIEQARFSDRLQVIWLVDATLLDREVPSLIVLPLVENAIRHGLSLKVGPGTLTISATAESGQLILKVEDDGLGAAPPLHLGIGLGNTRERLETLHGDRAGLSVDTQPGQGFRVRIHLPLTEQA